MIVDTSAIIAILERENGWEQIYRQLIDAPSLRISAFSVFEAKAVALNARLVTSPSNIDRFLEHFSISVVPFTSEHASTAVAAYERFGKGRHKAALNLGDCAAYATASLSNERLLYVGEDFARTDLGA